MEYIEIKDMIISNLKKNGYPEKKVSFPYESIRNFTAKYDFDLEDILGEMENEGVYHKKENNRIIFSSTDFQNNKENNFFSGMNAADMKKKAFEMMNNMSSDELAEIKNKVDAMSDEEKADMMKKAKEMGLL